MPFSSALFFNDQITLYLANKSNSSHFFQRIRVPLYTAILDIQVAGADAGQSDLHYGVLRVENFRLRLIL